MISPGLNTKKLNPLALLSVNANRQIKAIYVQQKSEFNKIPIDIPFKPLLRFPFLEDRSLLKYSLLNHYHPSDFIEIVIPVKIGLDVDIVNKLQSVLKVNIPIELNYGFSIHKELKLQMFFMPNGFLRVKSFYLNGRNNEVSLEVAPSLLKLLPDEVPEKITKYYLRLKF